MQEAKRRGLDCGVNNINSTQVAGNNTPEEASEYAKYEDKALCRLATNWGSETTWASMTGAFGDYVIEAKRRGLNCGVEEQTILPAQKNGDGILKVSKPQVVTIYNSARLSTICENDINCILLEAMNIAFDNPIKINISDETLNKEIIFNQTIDGELEEAYRKLSFSFLTGIVNNCSTDCVYIYRDMRGLHGSGLKETISRLADSKRFKNYIEIEKDFDLARLTCTDGLKKLVGKVMIYWEQYMPMVLEWRGILNKLILILKKTLRWGIIMLKIMLNFFAKVT